MNLQTLRQQIDQVDQQLLQLFEQRMSIVAEIAEIKKAEGLPTLDRTRELEKLQALRAQANSHLAPYTQALFEALFEQSRNYQQTNRNQKNLILIGMPGSGKSTIGKFVAAQLGRPLVDTDKSIEKATGRTIQALFQAEGEQGFRLRETRLLAELGQKSGLVITTGGGCVTQAVNHQHLAQNGVIVFLKRPLAYLPRTGRPLSLAGDLRAMYQTRLPQYQKFANFTIYNTKSPKLVAKKIVEATHEALGN